MLGGESVKFFDQPGCDRLRYVYSENTSDFIENRGGHEYPTADPKKRLLEV